MTLTANDLIQIENLLDEKLDEKLKLLPTRQEFLNLISEVMGELKTTRNEHVILDDEVSDHNKRIEKLEKIHSQGQHPTA